MTWQEGTDTLALSDLQVLAKTLDGEAANQGFAGQQAVASVIARRAWLGWKGDRTLRAACLHPAQFSCWLPGPDRNRIMKRYDPQCMAIAQAALAGILRDNTGGADSYIVTGTPAYWAKGLTPVAVIGAQSFYVTRKISLPETSTSAS